MKETWHHAVETTNTQQSVPTEPEERTLFTLHHEVEKHANGSKISDTALEGLHNNVKHCECFPLLEQYVRGNIPTFERLFANLDLYLDELKEYTDSERAHTGEASEEAKIAESFRKILAGRKIQIRDSVNRYVSSVIRFNQLKLLSADGARELKKQFENADHARRRAHNALIDSLAVYQTAIKNCQLEELGKDRFKHFNFEEWTIGTDARKIGPEKTVVFSSTTLRNRDFIRDWAIVSDFIEQLRLLGDSEWLENIKDHSV